MKKLKIAYLSSIDPTDKRAWSGTHYSIYNTLKKHVGEVVVLGPYEPKFFISVGMLITGLSQLLLKKRYNYRHSRFLSKIYAKYFNKKLKEQPFDLIVAPASACEMAYVKTNIPIVYISDSTIDLSLNYHLALSNLLSLSEKETRKLEKLAIDKSSVIIVSSKWALESIYNVYNIPINKAFKVPFGANMTILPDGLDAINKKTDNRCKLLFMGVNWVNKGGDIAFNCLIELLKLGFNAELTVCGCAPTEEKYKHEKMKVIPFINKNTTDGMKKLYEVFMEHDFLILPTRFDCTPIVICEASAFAVPCIIANTGGVAGHLHEGKNGYLIDYNDKGEGYANKIAEVISNKEAFQLLKKSTRSEYDNYLNWDNYGKSLKKIIDSILSSE